MLLRNKSRNSDIKSQFNEFKKQLLQTGKSPEEVLSELMKSGKINKEQLNNAMKLANVYRYLVDR